MVPKGWTRKHLGEFMSFRNGMNTDKSQYGSGEKFVNVMDIFGNDAIRYEEIIGKVQTTEKQLKNYGLKYGDVLFNRTSEKFDEIALSAVYKDEAPATFGGFVIRGRPSKGDIVPEFSVYAFQQADFRRQAIRFGQGAIRSNIGQKDLERIELCLPPLHEQTKISEILATWDNAVTTIERLLANAEDQKKALMQQLVTGKKRLTGFNGVWGEEVLGELARITKGIQLNRNTLSTDGSYPVINGGITASGYTEKFNRPKNTITISEGGNSCGYVAFQKSRFWCGGHCYSIDDPKVDKNFLFYALKVLETRIMRLRVGSGLPNIQKKDLTKLRIPLPSDIEEQQSIAAILSASEKAYEFHAKKLRLLRQEKKALMQQLLTGKRRVKVN